MRYFLISASLILGSCAGPLDRGATPKGQFATVQVESSNAEFKRLLNRDSGAVARVLQSPGSYNPTVLYALSDALFQTGRKKEAMLWFYTAQLRARSDANKCLDASARSGISVLNQRFGPQINKEAFRDMDQRRALVQQAVANDRRTGRDYDPRWLALHGIDAFTKTEIRFAPQSSWSAIDAEARQSYAAQFQTALSALKKH